MGKKVNPRTGSRLLGEELRRLRGTRSLEDIVALSRSEIVSSRVRSIAAPTLSQIENGISLPSLDSLMTLAAVHQMSVQQLLDMIVEDRLCASLPQEGDALQNEEFFLAAMSRQDAGSALSAAIMAERSAASAGERAKWRARRASCLHGLGFHQEAIWMYTECLEEPALTGSQRTVIGANLVHALAAAGLLRQALVQIESLESNPGVEHDAAMSGVIADTRASLLIDAVRAGVLPADRALGEALRSTRLARSSFSSDQQRLLILDTREGEILELQGQKTLAIRKLRETIDSAVASGAWRPEMVARLHLATVLTRSKAFGEATKQLDRAETIALEHQLDSDVFNISVARLRLARVTNDEAGVARAMRRCQRFYPLSGGRTPWTREFASLQGSHS